MPLKLSPIEYGDQKLQAYKDKDTKSILLPENVKTLGFLNLSRISSGQTGQFTLQAQGIDDSVIFHSVIASISGVNRREISSFSIAILDSNDLGFTFDIEGSSNQLISFDFPSNMKVSPSDQIIIQSQYNIEKMTISMQRIGVIFDIDYPLTLDVSSER